MKKFISHYFGQMDIQLIKNKCFFYNLKLYYMLSDINEKKLVEIIKIWLNLNKINFLHLFKTYQLSNFNKAIYYHV